MATVTIEYFGVSGSGKNVTEAKKDAGRNIERMIKHIRPRVYAWRGYTLVVSVAEYGAEYTYTEPNHENGPRTYSGSANSINDAILHGTRHIADLARQVGEAHTLSIEDTPDWLSAKDRQEMLNDWMDYDKFYRAHEYAVRANLDDPHTYACQHKHEYAISA